MKKLTASLMFISALLCLTCCGNSVKDEDSCVEISIKSEEYEIIYALNESAAAKELCAQLPLTTKAEPFSDNEITFYPPEKLSVSDAPLSSGSAGSLSYYEPWGDVVMFYAPCEPNGGLFEIGHVIYGKENIKKLRGNIEISISANQDKGDDK